MDSLKTDASYSSYRNIDTYALTSGQQSYDIGPTATAPFNVVRPIKIINANVILPSGGHMPLEIIDDDQRMDIFYPDLTASLPLKLNYKRSIPNGNLWLWFKPSAGYTLELETSNLLEEFTAITDSFSFPPGFYDVIIYKLARRFCTPAWGRTVDPSIEALLEEAETRYQSLNLDPPPLQFCDPRAWGISRGGNAHGITVENDIRTGRRFYK
jgi:hypothetical protein